MEYVEPLHAILAWDKHSQAMGFIAADEEPSGFLTARIDFLGRAQSLWSPRATGHWPLARPKIRRPIRRLIRSPACIGHSPGSEPDFARRLDGHGEKKDAIDLIARRLSIARAWTLPWAKRAILHPIKHGEIPAGDLQPYFRFSGDGRVLTIHTPFTPRPFDHTMSNRLRHIVSVTIAGSI